jgi:glycine/D-amino acid oxidase-like deaminating enzyme
MLSNREAVTMIDTADVVVIGAGGLGAATAFSLAQRGAGRVALLDRREPGSQTSPRAAGMAAHARTTDLMTDLMKLASSRLKRFSEETGQPLDWIQSGSLKVARRPADAVLLEREHERARRHSLDVELISADAARELLPLFRGDGTAAILWIGDDLYFDPAQVGVGYACAAEARGVRLYAHTTVREVVAEGGRVRAVETDRGRIETRVVVDAAGAWVRQLAASSGIDIQLIPVRHQLVITEPIDGVDRDRPMVRIMDAAVYVRPCDGGLLWGVFEEEPAQVDVDTLPTGFDMSDLQLDMAVLQRAAADVEPQLPILRRAPVREHRGGLPTMTADGRHIVGPVPGVEGFFVAGGCNVAGLSISPAIGEELAAWIVDGAPTRDLSALSPARLAAGSLPEDELTRQAAWQYRHFYGSA